MREKVSIIKKLFFIQLFTVFFINLSAEPYKPYPILFIHGYESHAKAWGVNAYESLKAPHQLTDSIKETGYNDVPTFERFLDYMNPYAIEWKAVDDSYTIPGDPAYPNKTFLEVVNFDDKWGKTNKDLKL